MVSPIIKVVLLDDEQFVRDGLSKLLAPAPEVDVIGSYDNGYHLINDLNDNSIDPDVIIADIRMPDINGLDFIKIVRKSHPHIYLVILSGYGEFEYAKQAIENQVYRYLLKPLDEKELFDCLDSIASELSASREHSNWKEYSFNLMFQSAVNAQPIHQLPFSESPRFAHIIYLYYKVNKEQIKRELLLLCEKTPWNGRVFEADDKHMLFLIFSFSETSPRYIFKLLDSLCSKLDIYAGISGSYQSFSFIPDMYNEARKAIGYKLFSKKRINFYSDIDHGLMSVNHNKCNELITAICLAKESDISARAGKLAELCKPGPQMLGTFSHLSKLLKQYASTLSEEFRRPLLDKAEYLERFELFETISEYKAYFHETVEEFYQTTKRNMEKDLGIKLNKATSFINANFNKELSLDGVSETINLSANYFSHLFRQKMGIGFVEYVTDLRIQKAKELLANTSYKIHEIARMIGFNEPKYFIRTFKKLEGMSPMVYKSFALQLKDFQDK